MPLEKDDTVYLWDMLDAAKAITESIPVLVKALEPLVPSSVSEE